MRRWKGALSPPWVQPPRLECAQQFDNPPKDRNGDGPKGIANANFIITFLCPVSGAIINSIFTLRFLPLSQPKAFYLRELLTHIANAFLTTLNVIYGRLARWLCPLITEKNGSAIVRIILDNKCASDFNNHSRSEKTSASVDEADKRRHSRSYPSPGGMRKR